MTVFAEWPLIRMLKCAVFVVPCQVLSETWLFVSSLNQHPQFVQSNHIITVVHLEISAVTTIILSTCSSSCWSPLQIFLSQLYFLAKAWRVGSITPPLNLNFLLIMRIFPTYTRINFVGCQLIAVQFVDLERLTLSTFNL
jgi:hypothetical protein